MNQQSLHDSLTVVDAEFKRIRKVSAERIRRRKFNQYLERIRVQLGSSMTCTRIELLQKANEILKQFLTPEIIKEVIPATYQSKSENLSTFVNNHLMLINKRGGVPIEEYLTEIKTSKAIVEKTRRIVERNQIESLRSTLNLDVRVADVELLKITSDCLRHTTRFDKSINTQYLRKKDTANTYLLSENKTVLASRKPFSDLMPKNNLQYDPMKIFWVNPLMNTKQFHKKIPNSELRLQPENGNRAKLWRPWE